jgi:hypothetical protein
MMSWKVIVNILKLWRNYSQQKKTCKIQLWNGKCFIIKITFTVGNFCGKTVGIFHGNF